MMRVNPYIPHLQTFCPHYCDDPEVQQFLADAMLDFREGALSAWQLFAVTQQRFGLMRCWSVHYHQH
jgi:hypothetical protein